MPTPRTHGRRFTYIVIKLTGAIMAFCKDCDFQVAEFKLKTLKQEMDAHELVCPKTGRAKAATVVERAQTFVQQSDDPTLRTSQFDPEFDAGESFDVSESDE